MDISKIDELTKIWLGKWFRNITFSEDSDIDVKEVHGILGGDDDGNNVE